MDSIRDALIQSANGRKLTIQVGTEMRRKAIERETTRAKSRQERQAEFDRREAIRGRIRTLKDLVHYTFVQYPRENNRPVRFNVYQASKDYVRDIAKEGGDAYEKLTRTLQFAPTSKVAFYEAVEALADCEHDFESYDSSDASVRHAA